MRKPSVLLVAIALAGCGKESSEGSVDTTLPNDTQSLVVNANATLADMNATEGVDTLMSNDFSSPIPSDTPTPAPYQPPASAPYAPDMPDGSDTPPTDNSVATDAD